MYKKILIISSLIFSGCYEEVIDYDGKSYKNYCESEESDSAYDGLEYLNKIRREMVMIELNENSLLDASALNHALYLKEHDKNGLDNGHQEIEGESYFTGISSKDRVHYMGYDGYDGEGISYGTDSYIGSINSLMTAIYHRFGLLSLTADEIGVGYANHQVYDKVYVYNRGNSKINDICSEYFSDFYGIYYKSICINYKEIPKANYLWAKNYNKKLNPKFLIYPYENQNNFCPTFYGETPEPLPNIDKPTGNPISIQFNDYYVKKVELNYFELYDENGVKVENTKLLTKDSDPNERFDEYEFALFPLKPLKAQKAYSVKVSFMVDDILWEKSWSFTTSKGRVYE